MLFEKFEELERKGIKTLEKGLEIQETPLYGKHKILYGGFGSQVKHKASIKFGNNYIDTVGGLFGMLYIMKNNGKVYKDALYKAIEKGRSVAIDLNFDRAADADMVVTFIEQLLTKDEIDLTEFFSEDYLDAIMSIASEEVSRTIKVNPNFSMSIVYEVKNCPTV